MGASHSSERTPGWAQLANDGGVRSLGTYSSQERDDAEHVNHNKGVEESASDELEREQIQAISCDQAHKTRKCERFRERCSGQSTGNGPFVD
jgi:hypothetical protein